MRALILFIQFGLPLVLAFAAGVASTIATQRYLRRRDERIRTRSTKDARDLRLRDLTTKQLLDEIATRDDLTTPKDN